MTPQKGFLGVNDPVEIVSPGSMTPLKRFRGVIDPAEIHMTPRKFKIVFF
jgi:hypothetical protein